MNEVSLSVNCAAQIVSGQDTTDADVEDVAATVVTLAKELYKLQNKAIKKRKLHTAHLSVRL